MLDLTKQMWRYTALAAVMFVTVLARTDNIAPSVNNDVDDAVKPPSETTFDGGKASIKCDKGFEVELNFTEPFLGVVQAVNSSCAVMGNGSHVVRLNLLYNETCGTKIHTGEFSNEITFRYNKKFVTTAVPTLTVKCIYGKPSVIPSPPLRIRNPTTPAPLPEAAPLKTFPSLMLLCGVLFLSVFLIGLLTSYYIFKRRRFQVIRSLPPYSGNVSDITKLSSNSDKVTTIPRSNFAPPKGRYPGSDSDSYRSANISESPSRVLRRSLSSDSRENKVIVHDEPNSWMQSPQLGTGFISNRDAKINMKEEHLINFLEQKECSKPLYKLPKNQFTTFNHHQSPANENNQPVYSEILRNNTADRKKDNEFRKIRNEVPFDTVDTGINDSQRFNEDYVRLKQNNTPYNVSETDADEIVPVVASRHPEVTTHIIDDVFQKTVIDKKTIEEIERRNKREIEPNFKSQPNQPNWDVTIINYPNPNVQEETMDWDAFSEDSSISSSFRPQQNIMNKHEMHDEQNYYKSSLEVPIRDHSVKNWDVLIKVLELPQSASITNARETYRNELILTLEDRKKWREIITTDSTLRTLLSTAKRREDFDMIRNDERYEKLFVPRKWDEIINILVPPKRINSEEDHSRNKRSSLSTVYEYDSDDTVTKHRTDINETFGDDVVVRSRKSSKSSLRSNVRSVGELTVNHAMLIAPENANDKVMYF